MDRGFGGLTTNGPCCTCTAYQSGCLGVSERQCVSNKGLLRATRRARAKVVKGKKLTKKNIAFVCLDKPTRDPIPRRQWIPARRLDSGFGEVYGGVFAGEEKEDEGYLLFTYQTASTAEG